MKCLVTRPIPGDPMGQLIPYYDSVAVLTAEGKTPRPVLEAAIADADVLICTLVDAVDEALLEKAPKLKCVITFSVGLDHIDVAAVGKRNLPLAHTPNVLTDATADLTWALILGAARRLKPAMRQLEEGGWTGFDPKGFLGLELRGATLGIFGFGKIGRAVAERAGGFGMNVLHGLPKDELLRKSDVFSIHCPLKAETRHAIGERELSLMKPSAVLVNTARGPIVDEAALVLHLQKTPTFFARLDVFEREPELAEGLASLPNALCVPHIGSATTTARSAMARVCIEEAIRFAKGEKLQYDYFGGGSK